MTRQVFARAVDMFRGHKHSFDFAWHNSARYDVCANARAGEQRPLAESHEAISLRTVMRRPHPPCLHDRGELYFHTGADRFIVAPAPMGQYPFNYSGSLEVRTLSQPIIGLRLVQHAAKG
jgi:hypothetical protein